MVRIGGTPARLTPPTPPKFHSRQAATIRFARFLLLSPAGRLSLHDFGLARMLEQLGMTVSGEFVGTPRYLSPEQITAGRPSSDVQPLPVAAGDL